MVVAVRVVVNLTVVVVRSKAGIRMTDAADEQKKLFDERKRLYERQRDDLSKRQISNAENLDRSILTYSGAGLALSLGFLKDFIPIARAKYSWALYGSWFFFTLAMVLVVISYVLSLKVLELELDRAGRYYLQEDEKAFTESGLWDACAKHVNHWMSAVAFAIALVLTTFFVSMNLRGANMSDSKGTKVPTFDGVTSMGMQPASKPSVDIQKGITGQPMQSITPSKPVSPAPAPQSQTDTTPVSKG